MTPRGRLGRVHRIAPPRGLVDFRVAVDAAGNATIVWAPRLGCCSAQDPPITQAVLRARRLTAKGDLGRTIVVASEGVNLYPRVAVAPSGRATIAWHYPGARNSVAHDHHRPRRIRCAG